MQKLVHICIKPKDIPSTSSVQQLVLTKWSISIALLSLSLSLSLSREMVCNKSKFHLYGWYNSFPLLFSLILWKNMLMVEYVRSPSPVILKYWSHYFFYLVSYPDSFLLGGSLVKWKSPSDPTNITYIRITNCIRGFQSYSFSFSHQ
jgi:hypothetical protein